MQFHCYMCADPLVPASSTSPGNLTEEHIILNAIGGRLKSKTLICNPCNTTMGSDQDAALAAQLDSLCSLLQIKRDRGTINNIRGKTEKGEAYILQDGYKPRPAIPTRNIEQTGPNQSKIELSAGTTKEMKQMLEGIKRKFPAFNVEEALSKATMTREYMQEPIHLSLTVGGEPAFRSITKSVINFYLYHGGHRDYILHLIPYLKGETVIDTVFHGNHLEAVSNRQPQEAIHLLHIKGDPDQKLLYGYAEYFSVFSFIVCLSEQYEGKAFTATYAIDPQTGEDVNKEVQLNLTPADLGQLKDHPIEDQRPRIKERLGKFMKIVDKKHAGLAIANMVDRITDQTFRDLPENAQLSEEEFQQYIQELVREWIKFANRRPPQTP